MDFLVQYWWAIPIGLIVLAFTLRRGPRNIPIDWETLATFLQEDGQIKQIDRSHEEPGSDLVLWLRDTTGSVTYRRKSRLRKTIETIDVVRHGETGFTATFENEVPTCHLHNAGREGGDVPLDAIQETILHDLLLRVRQQASPYLHPGRHGHSNAL